MTIKMVRSEGKEVWLHFSVKDSGIGIAADKLSDVLNAFEQGDNSTTRKYGGTGLGLSITTKLIERMDGLLAIDSVVGEGAEFYFVIKLNVECKKHSSDVVFDKKAMHGKPLDGLCLLVVEDNVLNRALISRFLEQSGAHVVGVENGAEAVEIVASGKAFDLVLMDLQMPVLNGLDATKQIRQMGKERLPIVAVTANAFDTDKEACFAAGMNGFFTKPIVKEKLIQMILDTLEEMATVHW